MQNTVSQSDLPPLARKLAFAANREGVAERIGRTVSRMLRRKEAFDATRFPR